MKKIVRMMCLAALMLSAGTMANAQFRQSVFLDGFLPTGSFASTADATTVPLQIMDMGKEAKIGFGLGYRASYRFDVGVGEVAPFVGVDFLWNTIAGKWSDMYAGYNYSTPNYFNLPVMAGVSYFYDELWNDITPYAEFGLGADFLFITPEGKGEGIEYFAYKPTGAFAWMIGVGAWFGRHVSAGLYYNGFGKHYIDYTDNTIKDNAFAAATTATYNAAKKRESRNVGGLMLRIGFHF